MSDNLLGLQSTKLNSRPNSESKHLYIVYNWTKQPDLTLFRQVWPLMTIYDLIWPLIILSYNFRRNSESKHMYIWYISTNRVDFTPIWRILWFHHKLSFWFANLLSVSWIRHLSREFTTSSSIQHYLTTKSLEMDYRFRYFTINSLGFSTKFWVKTFEYFKQFDQTARFDSF